METEKEIVYLFTKPKAWFKPFSWLIKWRIGRPYSHVAVAVYLKAIGDYKVYQASNGDVNTVMLQNFVKYTDVVYSVSKKMEKTPWLNAVRYMEMQTGKKYNLLGALASTLGWARKLNIGNDGDKSFFCSEYAYQAFQIASGNNDNLDSDYIDPADFELLIIDNYDLELKNGLKLNEEIQYL